MKYGLSRQIRLFSLLNYQQVSLDDKTVGYIMAVLEGNTKTL